MKKLFCVFAAALMMVSPLAHAELDQATVNRYVYLTVDDFDTSVTISKADLLKKFTGGSVVTVILHYDTVQAPTVTFSIIRKGKEMAMLQETFEVASKTLTTSMSPELAVINFSFDSIKIDSSVGGTALLTVVIDRG